ncbi:FAD-binding domain-containing protein [Hysterangium stoloniferum]|nr:FAD-binding domain-containing protein [Hysterangium stoloniferum]
MADFEAFKKEFKGEIVGVDSQDYSAAIARWAANAERNAKFIVFPKDESDVAAAIYFASSNKLPFAVKGGGHNPSGASSVEDGLCIDLSRHFNTTRVDPDNKLVYVGGGTLWKTVDNATIAHGLATVGGTVNHTGVGGLTLGGGYGWLSAEHGLVVDNLTQATVVIADGSVVTASPTSHPDLFWAIRGGGGNFGVVTEFVLRLHPQRRTVFVGPIVFPPPMMNKVFEAADAWWPKAGKKEGAVVVIGRGPNRQVFSQPAITVMLFYNGSEAEGRANFKNFYDIGPVADFATEMPFEMLNEVGNAMAAHGRRYYMSGTSLRSTMSPHASQVFSRMVALSEAHPKDTSLPPFDIITMYEFFPLGQVCATPPNAMAFRNRGLQPNIVCVVVWDKGEEEGADIQHARSFSREIITVIEAAGESAPRERVNEGYVNYGTDFKTKAQTVWGDNYPRLQRIKKEYDPNCLFNRWVQIQPVADV